MPEVSVIIPVYNAERYIPHCLEAVLAQAGVTLEALCVDDGSDDASLSILREIAAHDPRVRVVAHERNLGVSAARNSGIMDAIGEWLCFVDADDAPSPDFCRRLVEAGVRTGAEIAKGCYTYPDGARVGRALNRHIRLDKNRCHLQMCSAAFRRDFVMAHSLRFPCSLPASEDIVFLVEAAFAANAIAVDDDALISINVRKGSVTCGLPRKALIVSHLRAMYRLIRLVEGGTANPESAAYVLASFFHLMTGMIARNPARGTRRYVLAATAALFRRMGRIKGWNAELFARQLPEELGEPLAALEEGDALPLFSLYDRRRIGLCRKTMGLHS